MDVRPRVSHDLAATKGDADPPRDTALLIHFGAVITRRRPHSPLRSSIGYSFALGLMALIDQKVSVFGALGGAPAQSSPQSHADSIASIPRVRREGGWIDGLGP